MKFKEIKPGQTFKFKPGNQSDVDGHKYLLLKFDQYVSLTMLTTGCTALIPDEADVELVENETNVYHACRQAFVCGQERVPWHLVVHALREGLNMEKFKTYNLTEENYKDYSQLRELVSWLKLSLSALSVDNTKSQ